MRVGVDIGGTKTEAVALADDGTVLLARTLPTLHGARGVLETAAAAVAAVAVGAPAESVGVGVPGVVDPATGTVRTAVNLDLDHVELGAALAERAGVPVQVENDVKASALGAMLRFGADDATLTYLNVGTGVGVATVVRGHVLRGASGWAGELGHLVVEPDGDPCGCGQHGCVEAVVGGGSLGRRLAAFNPPVALPDLYADAHPRPEIAAEQARLVVALAHALVTAALAYDPDVIVVGGGVLTHGEGLLARTLDALRAAAVHSAFLAGLAIADRVRQVPAGWPVAAVGAALVGGRTLPARVGGA